MSRALRAGAELAPRYEVIEHLKRTQVSDIYDVWSEERHARCIAKALRPEQALDGDAARSLAREWRLLRSLSHPHIVRAYEHLTAPRPMLILETLEGATLGRLLADAPRQRLPAADLGWLGLHLCSALAYLHGRRILHLDLKPSNVVCDRGQAKLIDLSIARRPGRAAPGVGTPGYMAPEQEAGGQVSAATDVYGLAGLLFEAATGTRPSADAVLAGRSQVAVALGEVVSAGLAREPAERPTLAGVEAALERLVD